MSVRERKRESNSHQPLQCAEFYPLDPLPQSSHFLLDPRLRLFDLKLLPFRLLPDPALFEIQIQLNAGLGATDLITQAGIEFCQIVSEPLMRGERGRYVGGVQSEELRTKFGEVDFLRVVATIGIYQGGPGF